MKPWLNLFVLVCLSPPLLSLSLSVTIYTQHIHTYAFSVFLANSGLEDRQLYCKVLGEPYHVRESVLFVFKEAVRIILEATVTEE